MKKITLFLFLTLLSATSLFAQNLYVESLTLDENNLRAQINPKLDFNDKKCCIIMISTPNMDDAQRHKLEFEGDAGAEIVSTNFPTGEVELYISPHAATLKIKHLDLGVLDYDIPIDLKEMKTYRMVLRSAKATTIVEESLTANYLVINIEPKDARIFIDDEFVENKNGAAMKLLSIGVEHSLRIEKNLYHSLDTIVMTNASNTLTINKKLRPAFGYIEVKSLPESGATVIINDKEVGTTPFRSAELSSGEYEVRVIKSMYKQSSKTVRVIDGNTTEANIEMQPNFAEITLVTDSESMIYLDGNVIGKGKWTGRILAGSHIVEAKRESHRDIKRTITVEASRNETITIDNPIPIYGSLNIISDPLDATIYIDNQEVGRTPKILTQVLIGKHTIRIEKAGCTAFKKEIYVKEGERTNIDAQLVMTDAALAVGAVSAKGNSTNESNINKGEKQKNPKPKIDKTFTKTTFFTLNFAYSTAPQWSFGLTVGSVVKVGWFATFMTNFNFKTSADLECNSDGLVTTDNAHYYYPAYTKGSTSRLSLMGGVVFKVAGSTYIRAGLGYGFRNKFWETQDGTTVKSASESFSGLDCTAGVQFNFGGFVLSVDAVSTNFKTLEAKVGLGFGLRK